LLHRIELGKAARREGTKVIPQEVPVPLKKILVFHCSPPLLSSRYRSWMSRSTSRSASVNRRRLGRSTRAPLNLLQHPDDDMHGLVISLRRTVDELRDHDLAVRDVPSTPAVADGDLFIECLAQQGGEALCARRSAARVARRSLVEARVLWRFAVADRLIAFAGHGLSHLPRQIIEAAATSGVAGDVAAEALPTADDRIDVTRIEFETVTAAAGPFRGYKRRAAAHKTIQHDVAATGAIEDRIRHQRDEFHGRMQLKEVSSLPFLPEKELIPG
jgi:hypothetical protein